MSLPRYPKYKDSGVPWLGEVPEHWGVKRLKFLCTVQTGDQDTVNAIEDGQYPFFVRSQAVERIDSYTHSCEAVLTAGDGAGVGKVFHYYNGEFAFHQRVYMLNGFRSVSGLYLFFYLRENFYKVALEGGAKSTVDSLRMPLFLNFCVPVPPHDEQAAIIAFVEREAAKIDALVEEQQRLIELLKEKRQAVISHIITNGLNTESPMRDSGMEWLGDIPAHWEVTQLRRLVTSIEQGWSPQTEDREPYGDEWGVLKLNAVRAGRFDPSKAKALSSETVIPEGLIEQSGDFLLTRANTPELVGESCYVNEAPPRLILSDLIYRINLESSQITGQFLNLVLQTPLGRSQIEADARGSSRSMVKISHEHILSWITPLPPISEQGEIVDAIQQETERHDALIAAAARAIDLLQERRTALISAAVTGKIDVRGDAVTSLVAAKAYTTGFARQLLAAEILYQCHEYPTTGRVKLQKLIHLCEYVAEIDEVHASYLRKAAGPFDNKLMFGVAAGLTKLKWYSEVRDGNRTIYRPLEKAGEHKKYLARWESKLPKIQHVLELLGKAQTQQCEIVSTLYAAWNDLLIDGRQPSDVEIIHEASDPVRWHESKANIPSDKWPKALKWMRDNGLVPKGYGSHTKSDVAAIPGKTVARQLTKGEPA